MTMPAAVPNPESWHIHFGYAQYTCEACLCPRYDDDDENPVRECCTDGACPCHAYFHEVQEWVRLNPYPDDYLTRMDSHLIEDPSDGFRPRGDA
jgi:hypothetical protein